MSSLIGLSAFAWLALWLWCQSPYGRYIDHGDWSNMRLGGPLCTALPGGGVLMSAILYVGGWLLMLIAMMLPTTLPLLDLYRQVTMNRQDRRRLLGMVVSGYLMAWLCFGVLAHVIDAALHQLITLSTWVVLHGWAIGATVFVCAGSFQFTQLKQRCLDQCRTPMSFIMKHWSRGTEGIRPALRLGWTHGLFCIGCCWALMLLMFVLGTANVGAMLLLGATMALEKNTSMGKYLSAPLGIGLLLCGLWIVASHAG